MEVESANLTIMNVQLQVDSNSLLEAQDEIKKLKVENSNLLKEKELINKLEVENAQLVLLNNSLKEKLDQATMNDSDRIKQLDELLRKRAETFRILEQKNAFLSDTNENLKKCMMM